MKYIAGTAFTGVAALFVYLMTTAPNDDVEIGFTVGVIMSMALVGTAAWLSCAVHK